MPHDGDEGRLDFGSFGSAAEAAAGLNRGLGAETVRYVRAGARPADGLVGFAFASGAQLWIDFLAQPTVDRPISWFRYVAPNDGGGQPPRTERSANRAATRSRQAAGGLRTDSIARLANQLARDFTILGVRHCPEVSAQSFTFDFVEGLYIEVDFAARPSPTNRFPWMYFYEEPPGDAATVH